MAANVGLGLTNKGLAGDQALGRGVRSASWCEGRSVFSSAQRFLSMLSPARSTSTATSNFA